MALGHFTGTPRRKKPLPRPVCTYESRWDNLVTKVSMDQGMAPPELN